MILNSLFYLLFFNQLNVFFNEQHEDKHKSLPIVQISSIKYFMVLAGACLHLVIAHL